ncbi:MAG: ABC transporter ATP-binding protein [Desulfuromusa sp.]|nr:ABC transporter ATP-binding protein [Desulfuromusa sp.]
MPLLEVKDLGKQYAGEPLLSSVNFTLAKGEILCLLGPSGSGKTTLLRMLSGLEYPDQGDIFFDGKNLAGIAPHKRHFGMMFQNYALFPHKSIIENVCFGLDMQNWSQTRQQQRAKEILALVGLQGFEQRRIETLSGGEQQRVALARSLAPQPRLLLLDEPLGSLDRTLRDHLAGEIRIILKSQGVTAVFVTHDQSEAFTVADQIAILQQGQMEQLAPPEQLYRQPANEAVARFLGFKNILTVATDCSQLLKLDGFHLPQHLLDTGYQKLLIRPEAAKIMLSDSMNYSATSVRGIITKRIFQGQLFQIVVKTGHLSLSFNLPIDPPPPEIGEEIHLELNPVAIVPLHEERE